MNTLSIIFLLSLLLGQFGGFQIIPGVTIFIHDILATLILFIFLGERLHSGKQIQGLMIKPIAIFTSIGVVSLLLNIGGFSYTQLLLGSLYLWRFLLYASIYLLVLNSTIPSISWIKRLYLVGVGFSLLGLVQYAFFPSLRGLLTQGWDEHYYRLFSTLLDPNYTGLFLVLTFFIGILLHEKKVLRGIIPIQILLCLSLLLTHSRSSFVAFGVALSIYGLRIRQPVWILVILAGSLFYLGIPNQGIDTNNLLRRDSTIARIQSYKESVSRIKQSPLIGIGYNMIRYQTGREKILDADGIVSRDAGGLNSSLLVILVTTGIIGFSVFVYVLYSMVCIIQSKNDIYSHIGVVSLAAILIHSVFNNSLLYSWILIWLWIFIGALEKRK